MSTIASLATSLSSQKQQTTGFQMQVAMMKKVLDTQEQMGEDLLALIRDTPRPQGADPVRGVLLDVYA